MSTIAEAPIDVKRSQSGQLANRITGLLAWAGVFVAGVLTYAHLTHKYPPCGMSGGCETVANHPSSQWFGIPVAIVGLVGYLLLAGLSIARSLSGADNWRKLTMVSLYGTLFGFFASVYFMFTAVAVIEATCLWCVASAIVMTTSLIVTGWLWSCPDVDSPPTKVDSIINVGGFFTAAIAAVAVGMNSKTGDVKVIAIGTLTEADLIPDISKVRGDASAPLKVIEFADFNCPGCRSSTSEMDKIYRKAAGKIQWSFRNFPLPKLPGHETSTHAAILAELAAKKGTFWKYFDTVYEDGNTERIKTVEGLKQVAIESGLTMPEINGSLFQDSEEAQSVATDVKMALVLGINQTPTFVLLAKGVEPKAVSGPRLSAVLEDEPYKSILQGK